MRTINSLIITVLLAACGGGGTDPTPTTQPPTTVSPTPTDVETTESPGDAIEVEAEDIAFDTQTVTAAAGSQVAIQFKNRDALPHNMGFYLGAAGDAIFQGDTISGPDAETLYTFEAPADPGTYRFQCDVHPDQMSGTFEVT